MIRKIFTAVMALVAVAAHAAVTPAMADSAYVREQYGDAIALYEQLLAERGPQAEVYYNLGNAWYRRGNVGRAVLNYERALRIDPSNSDARANLEFVRSRLQDKPEENNSLFTRLHRGVVAALPANAWAWIALASFVLLCAAAAVYIFSGNVLLRKAGFFGGLFMIVVTIYFVVVAAEADSRLSDRSEAIVTVPSTLLNSSPRQPRQTEKVVPLHEGTKVEIIDSVSTPDDPVSPRYYKVRINGSTPAWLRSTDVERI